MRVTLENQQSTISNVNLFSYDAKKKLQLEEMIREVQDKHVKEVNVMHQLRQKVKNLNKQMLCDKENVLELEHQVKLAGSSNVIKYHTEALEKDRGIKISGLTSHYKNLFKQY